MKFLKYLLAALLLLTILFFAKGLITPSISYENEVTVNKPAQEAWNVMSDEENLPKWIKGFKSTTLVSGTANTVGAVSNIVIEEGGKEMIMQETINKVKPNELLDMTFSMDFMDMDYLITFTEKDGKTTIKSTSTTKGNGLFAKSIVSFLTSTMKTQEDVNLAKLKQLIDENTKSYNTISESN